MGIALKNEGLASSYNVVERILVESTAGCFDARGACRPNKTVTLPLEKKYAV